MHVLVGKTFFSRIYDSFILIAIFTNWSLLTVNLSNIKYVIPISLLKIIINFLSFDLSESNLNKGITSLHRWCIIEYKTGQEISEKSLNRKH